MGAQWLKRSRSDVLGPNNGQYTTDASRTQEFRYAPSDTHTIVALSISSRILQSTCACRNGRLTVGFCLSPIQLSRLPQVRKEGFSLREAATSAREFGGWFRLRITYVMQDFAATLTLHSCIRAVAKSSLVRRVGLLPHTRLCPHASYLASLPSSTTHIFPGEKFSH